MRHAGWSTRRLWTTVAALILLLLLTALPVTADDKLELEYTFERPDIQSVSIVGEMFDRIIMENAPRGGAVGEPALPSRGASILLPLGTAVESIEIIPGERVYLGDGYYVEPVQRPVRLTGDPGPATPPEPDAAIYASTEIFPTAPYQEAGTQSFRGYSIVYLRLQPVEYVPATGELYYYPDLRVVVNTVPSDQGAGLYRGLAEDEEEVASKVDNPEEVSSYWAASKGTDKFYDLLILTTPALAAAFQPLKDYHDSTGIATEIRTTTDVGSTNPDDVRAYILDQYIIEGIRYVIIGGDDDLIPAKDLYVQTDYGYNPEIEYNMPADIYFGCLDGTYNYDGDSNWGEPNDGDGGGDVDLVAEVYVGRASVENTTEATRFVDKTIWYLSGQHGQPQKALMVGEYLGFGGVADYAAATMEQLEDGSSADGYTTVGIPTADYDIDELFDRDWPGNNWPQSELVSRINAGLHILNHLGHGSPDYAMKLYNPDIVNQIFNTDLCLVYSQTCLAGHFDGTDCWAETINIKKDEGAFAVIMNARYGFGEYSSTDGASQRFNREFWDAVFNPAESKPELGRANQDSKEDNLYRIGDACMRWCYYELNLFGDPTVVVKGAEALEFAYPDGIPEAVYPGQPTTVQVAVTGIADGTPAPGSGKVHYSINGGAYQTDFMTEISAGQYEATLPAISCGDYIGFYFSAEEVSSGEFFDPDPTDPFVAQAATSVTVAFEDDFETDKGWIVTTTALDGPWDRGVPVGLGERGDPASDFDGSGSCYLTDNVYGNSDVDDGTTTLTSPTFDGTGGEAMVHYARWYSNNFGNAPYTDSMMVYISNDNGASWQVAEVVGPTQDAGGGWVERNFWVTDILPATTQMKMRFEASDLGDGSVVEAAMDDFSVTVYECDQNIPNITTETVPDWTVGYPYSFQMEASGGSGALTWADRDGDLAGSGLSLSATGLLSGMVVAAGQISFTAQIADESSQTDEQEYSFTINDPVQISTTSIPDRTAGVAYSQTLAASGGTGTLTWIDKNADLAGTGLSLSLAGVLSGTPTAGPVSFTAQATDQVGAGAEQVLACTINPALDITTTAMPDAVVGMPYSEQLISTGGTGTITWSDKYANLVGTGLSLSSTGLLSGMPISEGTISFTARIVDEGGGSDETPLTVDVNFELQITTETLPEWTVGCVYSHTLTAGGGSGELTWIDKNSDLDGTGLSLSSAGVLYGTPLAAGDISFIAEVTDELSGVNEKALTLTINEAVVIMTESLPDWTAGVAYSQQLTCGNGTGEMIWADLNGDLVGTGLTLSAAGLVEGIPTTAAPVNFTARVTDAAGATDDHAYAMTINDTVAITSIDLPEGTEGEAYSQQLTASGGTGDLVWSDFGNDLDGTGLTLSSEGLLAGTPVAEMSLSLTVRATDDVGGFDEQVFALEIGPSFICGDIDNSGGEPDISDLVYLVEYMFNSGPEPPIVDAADVDADGEISVSDLVALVDFMFAEGPLLVCP